MTTTYTYNIAADLPGGKVNAGRLREEIAASPIVTALANVATAGGIIASGVTTGGALSITFMAALSAADKTTLDGDAAGSPKGGLLAAHDSSPTLAGTLLVEAQFVIGGMKTDIDGVVLTAAAGEHKRADYAMPESLYLQGAQVQWRGCQLGDRGWIALIHPSSQGGLATDAALGAVTVDVGALAPYYDPLNGARYIEFWSADESQIIEVAKIASVAGSVVTLVSALASAHPMTERIKARFDGFSPVRGGHGLDGGMRVLNDYTMLLRNEAQVTAIIPAGMILSARFIASAAVATRELAVNFIFRKPLT